MPSAGPDAHELRELAERTRGEFAGLRETLRAASDTRREGLVSLSDEATRIVESLAAQVADELAQDLAHQQEEVAANERAALQADREAFEAERAAWQTEREQWEEVRNQVEAELASQEQQLLADRQAMEASRPAGKGDEALLYEKLEKVVAERDAAAKQLAGAAGRIGELTETLEQASGRLTAAGEVEQELTTLREKFDLVMTDLQAHREHVAALEGELATRPATPGADPAELEQLRQERDDYARRLQEQAHTGAHAEPSAELEDLRTRFEMAVEDIRELRTENEDLRQRLESAPAAGDASAAGDDWEAQKQRLLASLSDEGEPAEPERQEERATIQGTIQITDEVVAEKDREIERLRGELEQSGGPAPTDAEPTFGAVEAALLDEDAVIQAERERLAALEAEWQEKLRQAELELSLERAKIARSQSELEEQQIELETLRGSCSTSGESKRRWMDKLGLGNDGK